MVILPRTRSGWAALITLVVVAALIGGFVSPAAGPIGFALIAMVLGSLAIVTAEAWRADVWRTTGPPEHISPGQSIDYALWNLRRRRRGRVETTRRP